MAGSGAVASHPVPPVAYGAGILRGGVARNLKPTLDALRIAGDGVGSQARRSGLAPLATGGFAPIRLAAIAGRLR